MLFDKKVYRLFKGFCDSYLWPEAKCLPHALYARGSAHYVLIALAIISTAACLNRSPFRQSALFAERVTLPDFDHEFGYFAHALIVIWIADVEYLSIGFSALITQNGHQAVHSVAHVTKTAAGVAAVNQVQRLAVEQVPTELRHQATAAFFCRIQAVQLRPHPIERTEKRKPQALLEAIGPDDAIQ